MFYDNVYGGGGGCAPAPPRWRLALAPPTRASAALIALTGMHLGPHGVLTSAAVRRASLRRCHMAGPSCSRRAASDGPLRLLLAAIHRVVLVLEISTRDICPATWRATCDLPLPLLRGSPAEAAIASTPCTASPSHFSPAAAQVGVGGVQPLASLRCKRTFPTVFAAETAYTHCK